MWRRDFANGLALVNEPGAPSRVLWLGTGFADLDGTALQEVTMPAGSGLVLRKVPVPTPTPTPTPSAPEG